jgi:membrane protease subunit (stomatin/prohibitin family)
MGIFKAFKGAVGGTLADQWKDIITAGHFDEHTVVAPGVFQQTNNGRGSNYNGSDCVITNGSRIFVPENTAAFIFSQAGIEEIVTVSGGFEYNKGQESIFNGGDIEGSIINQVIDRVGYGGQTADQKQIAFVNLREIRDIKFGTRGPLMYNDLYYGVDLGILAFGTFSLKVIDAEKFIKNYVPANTAYYSFDDPKAKAQILSEFIQSFTDALNSLSKTYRISELPSQANELAEKISGDDSGAGTWRERYGFELVRVAVENIDFAPDSKELVKQYSATVMEAGGLAKKRQVEGFTYQQERGFDVSEKVAQNEGVGQFSNMGIGLGMISGVAGTVGNTVGGVVGDAMSHSGQPTNDDSIAQQAKMSFEEQIETVKKLKDLLDAGVLSQGEFDAKKKEIMGL